MNSKKNPTLAIPFISFSEGKGFKLSQEAEEFLMNLPENRKLGIVSIVGKYRTGKSFFVNRVLLNQKKGGFQVGPTINPCTKGLWLWKKTIQSPSNEDMDIILIDTEGFGGMDENANHDSRIFLFSLLLSSFFIYNSVGSIDENALNTLNLIINLAKDIQTKTNNYGGEENAHFPSFLWVVRDFTLQLVGKTGQNIGSKEYLENALEFQNGASDAVANKNKIRRLLKQFFPNRDCQVMVRPVQSEKDLQRLDEMDNSQLRPEFVKKVNQIRDKVFHKVTAKKINHKQLNGHLLVALCKGYMEAINKGMLPNVQSAWYYVCRSEGVKAIQQVSNILEEKIEKLLSQPLNSEQLIRVKSQLREEMLTEFKNRSLGSEESNPDLLQKLERRLQNNFDQLVRKNKSAWARSYKQKTQRYHEIIRDRIFREQFDNFADFVQQFQHLKEEYDEETKGADPEKWTYFNEISEQLYRLAGQTITNKMNHNLEAEKNILEQKVKMQSEELEQKQKKQSQEKNVMKNKIEELELQNARLQAADQTNNLRLSQFKDEYDRLSEKTKKLEQQNEEKQLQFEKLTRELKKINTNQIQEAKNEANILKSNMEKQKTLFEMEKKYFEEEIDRYKERCNQLENQNKKMRSLNNKLSTDLEEVEIKFEEKEQECNALQQSNTSFSKKIENLLAENSKKSQMMGEHNEWLLEKAYLENQVSFLKNTLNENKRLHDALLVALQQSIASSQGECNNQLVEANKNMSAALEKMQQRYKILEEKYQKVKAFKKILKNCTAMQCCHCNKWVQASSFSYHLEECGENSISLREKTLPDFNQKQNIHISVSQNIIKETDDKKKPYIEYIVQVSTDERKWKVSKQYRQFTELNQKLITKFPSLKFPQSFMLLADSKNLMSSKKNTIAEERRKNIQHCLRDLAKIEEIQQSYIFREFLEFDR